MTPADRRPSICWRETWIVAGTGALSLLPLLFYRAMFDRLFWFGDEFDLIDQFDRMGFWHWVWVVFAENFVPLFKIIWGGAVFATGGSYFAMLWLLWAAHVLTVIWLGRLLRGCRFGWPAVIFSQLVFGLAPSNYETLTWTVQASAVLALTFQLVALDLHFRSSAFSGTVAASVASALSFSRGVLTGPLIVVATWLTGPTPGRWRRTVVLLVPSILVAVLITVLAVGNHNHMHGHFAAAVVYGLWYFCLNPAYLLFAIGSWGWRTTVILGTLKLALFVWAIRRSQGSVRALIIVLLAFDLGNAVLLGVGRFHTGLLTVTSSRYQYGSLAAVVPAAGFALDYALQRLRMPSRFRRGGLGGLGIALAAWLVLRWPVELDHFSVWRGTDSRRALAAEVPADALGVPGIPFMTMGRAQGLIAKYDLH